MTAPKRDPHVAVIYVHGMGEQRRLEETARLVDALDIYLNERRKDENEFLHKIDPGIEKSRVDEDGSLIKYISASFNDKHGGGKRSPVL